MVYFNSGTWTATVVAAGLASTVLGDTRNWNPTGEGCVDSKGFLSCYEDGSSDATSCVASCEKSDAEGTKAYQDCILGCNGYWLASNVGCWIQSCWNQVYSCEYQLTAASYFSGTGLVQNRRIPFYPPPDDAKDGACSCNLGYVYGNKTFIEMNNCISSVGSGNLDLCRCCQFSTTVSNILNVCPKSDLSIMGFATELENTIDLISDVPDKCAILDESPGTCVSQFGFQYYGDKIHNPLNLPAGEPGNQPLSNLPGNAFTDAGNEAITLELHPGYTSVITPAPFSANAGVPTETVGGSAIITGSGGAGGSSGGTAAATGKSTETGSTASPTPSNSAGAVRINAWAGFAVIISALIF